MKHWLIILLLSPNLGLGQEPEPVLQQFKVRLVDFSNKKMCAPCGWRPEVSMLKFTLIEDEQELKKDQDILVVIGCAADEAETYLEKTGVVLFKDKQEYILTVYKPSTEPSWITDAGDWYMPYTYKNLKLPRYFYKSIDRLQ